MLGTRHLLGAALDTGVDRVVVTGSFSAVGGAAGRPSDERMAVDPFERLLPYARSKVAAEHECLKAVADGLSKGERIDFRGFGAFAVRESAARSGRNPRTGETIQIAARRTPTFKVGKELKELVNNSRLTSQITGGDDKDD